MTFRMELYVEEDESPSLTRTFSPNAFTAIKEIRKAGHTRRNKPTTTLSIGIPSRQVVLRAKRVFQVRDFVCVKSGPTDAAKTQLLLSPQGYGAGRHGRLWDDHEQQQQDGEACPGPSGGVRLAGTRVHHGLRVHRPRLGEGGSADATCYRHCHHRASRGQDRGEGRRMRQESFLISAQRLTSRSGTVWCC